MLSAATWTYTPFVQETQNLSYNAGIMEQNIPGSPDPNSPFASAVPSVWPPPPTNSPFSEEGTGAVSPLAGFREQSVWLVFFLTLITLGIYGVFWLRRQGRLFHQIRPDLMPAGALLYGNIVLGLTFLSAGLDIASMLSDVSTLDTLSSVLDKAVGVLVLVLAFQVRNGFNSLIGARKGTDWWFSGVYTWLLNVVYLQYKLNKTIRRLRMETLPIAAK